MKVCNICKAKNDDTAKFCRSCGRILDVQEDPKSSDGGSTFKVIVGLLCFIGIIGSIIAYWNGAPRYPTIWIAIACGAGLSWAMRS